MAVKPHATPSTEERERAVVEEAARRLDGAAPREILRWAVERYRPKISLSCSFGMQSVVMIDMLARMDLLRDVEVFYLDTGVLFPETHQTRLRLQERYGFEAVRVTPEIGWEEQKSRYGGHLYERGAEGIDQCCHIRKVAPLQRHLLGKAAWVTGMRRGHSRTRASVPVVLWDEANNMPKVNPVAAVDEPTLWAYIQTHGVPYNPLYDAGYRSIGCNTPVCTRRPGDGDDARAGRWAGTGKTECGIHLDGKTIKSLGSSQL